MILIQIITIACFLSSILTYVVEEEGTICLCGLGFSASVIYDLLDCIAFILSVVPFLNLVPITFISQLNVSYFSLCREFEVNTLYSLKISLHVIAASLECPHTVI